jgi:carboxylesterase type B
MPTVYNYVFTHAQEYNGWGPEFSFCYGYPCHAADLIFEFDPLPGQYWNFTAPEKRLSQQMITYYTNFMRTGDPNVGLSVPLTWPKWSPQAKSSLFFQTNLNVTTNYRDDACSFWDRIGYNHGFRNITNLVAAKLDSLLAKRN